MKAVLNLGLVVVMFAASCAALPPPESRPIAEKWTEVESTALDGFDTPIVFMPDRAEEVTIATVAYDEGLTADIYYPAGFDPDKRFPAVVFIMGIADSKVRAATGAALQDIGQVVSWAQSIAARGMIGITYRTSYPPQSTAALMEYLMTHAERLRLDTSRLGFWSCSDNSNMALSVITKEDSTYRDGIRAAVFYYGTVGFYTGALPPDIQVLVAIAGQDSKSTNAALRSFAAEIGTAGGTVHLVEYEQGRHGFDLSQNTDESRRIIRETLDFLAASLEASDL